MILPSLADYVAAFRRLREVTTHPDLKTASVWLDPAGNPVVFRGRESAVFCVRSQERKLAVKVFLGDFTDRPHRYTAISAELRKLDLPYIMAFRFADDAITVGNATYPVAISYWADGEPLHLYIAKNLRNPTALRELSVKWLQLSQAMNKAGVAHGDLEPNNILVSEAGIKLVDYDDFYVPELENFPSRTMGSPNFQHPKRNLLHFGPYLDNVSSWVIYTSLVAVSKDRELWSSVPKGGEQLLFTRDDLAHPGSSEILQRLKNTSDKVRQLASSLENLTTYEVPDVPPLDPTQIVPASKPLVSPFAATVANAPSLSPTGQRPADSSLPASGAIGAAESPAAPQAQPASRDSHRDSSGSPVRESQKGGAAADPSGMYGNYSAAGEPASAVRPQSVTTRELPLVSRRPGRILWAAALVSVAGATAAAFFFSRGTFPGATPGDRHGESSPAAQGAGSGTVSDTTTGAADASKPAPPEGGSPREANSLPPNQPETLPPSQADSSEPGKGNSPTPAGSAELPPNKEELPPSNPKGGSPPPSLASAHEQSGSSSPPTPKALKALPARSAIVDDAGGRNFHATAPSRQSYTPATEQWPPQVEPIDEAPPKHSLETHPKFDRIRSVRTRLEELKAAGVDTTTSRQLLDAVETLAGRGNSDVLETKLQDLEYRLGLRASKD